MQTTLSDKIKRNKRAILLLFIATMLFKFALDIGYWKLVSLDTSVYILDFNLLKYIVGLIWIIIIFLAIGHDEYRPSSFLLYIVYIVQIIPLTTIYSLGNNSSIYYNLICFSFLVCEIAVGYIKNDIQIERNVSLSRIFNALLVVIVVGTSIIVFCRNGIPSLMALDIYNVYELREENPINVDGNLSYLYTWMISVIIPFFLAKTLIKKEYVITILLCALALLMYLYSGHKTIFFMIPLVVIVTLWSKRKNFYKEIILFGCIGFALILILALLSPIGQDFFQQVFSLFGRRVMLLSANNKFVYYDFFTENPQMGFGGIFPRWLLYVPNDYEDIVYTHVISDIYFGKPEMGSNTGFFAEGYMRFGYLGTVVIFFIFTMILRQIDKFGQRNSYALAIGTFIYPTLMLSDAHLMDSFVMGPWMLLFAILLLDKEDKTTNHKEPSMKMKTIIHLLMFKVLPYSWAIKIQYYVKYKRRLDFNNLQLFHEKMQYLSCYYKKNRVKDVQMFFDKLNVRHYVQEKIGDKYLTKLYGVYENPEQIDFDMLPEQFVLKGTQSTGHNILCRNKSTLNKEKTIEQLKKWLDWERGRARLEPCGWQFDGKAKIICEEYIQPMEGLIPDDIKIFCFNGRAEYIYMMHRDMDKNQERLATGIGCVYDRNWNYVPVKRGLRIGPSDYFEKPSNLKEIIDIAEKLSMDFPFVRVDLYDIAGKKIYFGELTLIPGSGFMEPIEYEYSWGKKLILPHDERKVRSK